MAGSSAAIFAVSALLQVAITTCCALLPLRAVPGTSLRHLFRSYGVGRSSVDVWLLSLAQLAVNCALLAAAAPGRHYQRPPRFKQAQVGLTAVVVASEVALLTKAVGVAVLAPPAAWPSEQGCGLAPLFVAVAASVLLGLLQWLAAAARLRRWEAAVDALAAMQEPLLGKEGEGARGKKRAATTIGDLLRLSYPDAPLSAVAFTAGSFAALAQAALPYYSGRIIDAASIQPDRHLFHVMTGRLVGAAFVCALFTGVRGGLFTVVITRLNMRLRERLFRSLLAQEIGFYDTTKTGDITSRLAADTTTVSDQIGLNLNILLRSLTQAIMVLVFMTHASWRLTIVTFIMVPFILLITRVYGRYYRQLSKAVQTALADANGVAEEALSTMTTVKAHAAEAGVEAAYGAKLAAYYTLQNKEALAYAAYAVTNTFLPNTVAAAVLFYGGTLVLADAMSPGALVSFMLYQQSLLGAFQSVGDVFSALTAAVGAADKVMELMQRPPRIREEGQLVPAHFAGQLQLRDVLFSYPARPAQRVLSGLSLEVAAGEVVALVGPSGGGKSSIVKLLQRFYVPESGQVLMDGREVGVYDKRWLKRRLAIVSQEPVLYARSVRRNICFGLEEEDGVPPQEQPSAADVEEAARLANAHDFIVGMPDGYDTECGEKGVALSGGQKQRIAIARALVRKPSVLLLDEATSALDADSEAVVQEALDRTMAHRTVVVIAHRLSTIQGADRIVVISSGAVRETGSHEALLEAGGVYAQLVRRQMTRSESRASLPRPVSSLSLLT